MRASPSSSICAFASRSLIFAQIGDLDRIHPCLGRGDTGSRHTFVTFMSRAGFHRQSTMRASLLSLVLVLASVQVRFALAHVVFVTVVAMWVGNVGVCSLCVIVKNSPHTQSKSARFPRFELSACALPPRKLANSISCAFALRVRSKHDEILQTPESC